MKYLCKKCSGVLGFVSEGVYQCCNCGLEHSVGFSCPDCGGEISIISGCGSETLWCVPCKKMISHSRVTLEVESL